MSEQKEKISEMLMPAPYINPRVMRETDFREMSKISFFSGRTVNPNDDSPQDAEEMLAYLRAHEERDFSFAVRRIIFEKADVDKLIKAIPENAVDEFDIEKLKPLINQMRSTNFFKKQMEIAAADKKLIYKLFEALPVEFYKCEFETLHGKSEVPKSIGINSNIVSQKGPLRKRENAFLLAFILELSSEELDKLLTEEMDTFGIDYYSKEESVYAYCLDMREQDGKKPYKRAIDILSLDDKTLRRMGIMQCDRFDKENEPLKTYEERTKNVIKELIDEILNRILGYKFIDKSDALFDNSNTLNTILNTSDRIDAFVEYFYDYTVFVNRRFDVTKKLYAGIPRDDTGNQYPNSKSRFPKRISKGILTKDKLSNIFDPTSSTQVKKSYIEIMLFNIFAAAVQEIKENGIYEMPDYQISVEGTEVHLHNNELEYLTGDTEVLIDAFKDNINHILRTLHLGSFQYKSTLDQLCEFCLRQERPLDVFDRICKQAYAKE